MYSCPKKCPRKPRLLETSSESSRMETAAARPNPGRPGQILENMGRRDGVHSNGVGYQAESLTDRGYILETSSIQTPSEPLGGEAPPGGRLNRRCIADISLIHQGFGLIDNPV